MRAFAIDELGHPGSVREVTDIDPGEGQVRIRVAASGLNPFDNSVVQGYLKGQMEHRFPLVPGMDAAGAVESVGDGDVGWAVGDEVFGSVGKMYLGEGTLAEFVTMAAATVARRPSAVDAASAAAIPVAGVTALTMVDSIAVPDDGILVAVGATGGVGSYLVQLATKRGARVVAVCSAANADYGRSLGAVDTIDYAAGAADVDALAERGIGAVNVMGAVTTASLETLAAMVERGDLVTPELHTCTLAGAADALAAVASGHVRGKIVVVPE